MYIEFHLPLKRKVSMSKMKYCYCLKILKLIKKETIEKIVKLENCNESGVERNENGSLEMERLFFQCSLVWS